MGATAAAVAAWATGQGWPVSTLEEDIKVKLALAEEKKAEAEEMAEHVERERGIVEEEGRKADIEHAKCDEIAQDVSEKAADAEAVRIFRRWV